MKLPRFFGKPKRRSGQTLTDELAAPTVIPVRRRPPLPRLFLRRVVGHSMSPTLKAAQVVIAVGPVAPRVGEVVVLLHDGREKIKRVQQVRPGEIFVVGDHAAHSTDSRTFGWVDASSVRGRVVWPYGLRTSANQAK